MSKRLRVLVFAYDAHPERGSESASGWGVTRTLAAGADVTAVVAAPTAGALRARAAAAADLHLEVLEVPDSPAQWVGRALARWHRQLEFLSYLAWMRTARRVARAHLATTPHDVAVHASYGVHWLPSPVVDLGLPSVWGPTGGGVRTPRPLLGLMGWKGALGELERNVLLGICARLPASRRTADRATVVMVENDETRDRLPEAHRERAEMLNRAVFAPVPAVDQAPGREPYLLFPSSLVGRKGGRLALEAFARTSAGRLAFVADGYERAALQERARELGVDDRVDFLGRVPRDEYFSRVTEAAAVVFTGVREEGGAALVEAMKLGAPVIVLDHGGAGWIARQGDDPTRVWRVAPAGVEGTVRDLAEAMGAALAEPVTDARPLLDEHRFAARLWSAVERAAASREGAGGRR